MVVLFVCGVVGNEWGVLQICVCFSIWGLGRSENTSTPSHQSSPSSSPAHLNLPLRTRPPPLLLYPIFYHRRPTSWLVFRLPSRRVAAACGCSRGPLKLGLRRRKKVEKNSERGREGRGFGGGAVCELPIPSLRRRPLLFPRHRRSPQPLPSHRHEIRPRRESWWQPS